MQQNQNTPRTFHSIALSNYLQAIPEYNPQLIVNNKLTKKKVLTTIDTELQKCNEFWFSVAFVTTDGIATIINALDEVRNSGRKGKILVSQYLNFTQPEALKRLLQFENIELKIAVTGSFHSKGYLFRQGENYNLIIGSSNLTANALCSNIEWNLKISAAANSNIIFNSINEFKIEFDKAVAVDEKFITSYQIIYAKQIGLRKELAEKFQSGLNLIVEPNEMQIEALSNINKLRSEGKNKALLISATGTGKTFLSAFDAKKLSPKKFLFVVHRRLIAETALKTFRAVFGPARTMGLYSGSKRELDCDFLFSTVQTISKDDNIAQFEIDHFDYIVIDETHRAGASSYDRLIKYFKPKFLLGMTATPERMDGGDVFKLFDYNIAYEIRLHKALEHEMLSPFHYYGVKDITVDGNELNDNSDFTRLTSKERIRHIIEKAKFYGCDDGIVRGLIFCNNIEECQSLSTEFNKLGLKTIALSGSSTDDERNEAITLLESENKDKKIDYIITRDIFNEGVDIPKVNQIIMLRPTQSAIVFVQQLGRGLRKLENKEYLTVIDFIGNYNNNYMVPIALYGDTTFNKDTLRRLMASKSNLIPGNSTVNFDAISRKRIFEAIDSANMQLKRDLVNDYKLLKYKLGRIPMMMDFIEHGARDPYLFVGYSKSYYNFVFEQEENTIRELNDYQIKLLELFSNEINNGKRVVESLMLFELVNNKKIEIGFFKELIYAKYNFDIDDETLKSCISNLNFKFVTENYKNKLLTIQEIYKLEIVSKQGQFLVISPAFKKSLENFEFNSFLRDNINYSINSFDQAFTFDKFFNGFILYKKYSRKDVFRILNWDKNPLAQNVGGYLVSEDKQKCPIFVTYHKHESISESIKYDDGFINHFTFKWDSKSPRTLNSPEIILMKNYQNAPFRMPLFIQKNNDEGIEFYYFGEVIPIEDSFEQSTMKNKTNKKLPVVKLKFLIDPPVDDFMYDYITKID